MNRQNVPCANLKLNNCQGIVTQRGNILCETCTETRKSNAQNKKEFDFDSLMIKYREIESQLSKYKCEIEELKQLKNSMTERINTLLEDKKTTEVVLINNSQLILDNEKLSIDNQQLKILIDSLRKQNELLSKRQDSQPPLETKKYIPQTSRSRGLTAFSKIPIKSK